MEIKIRKTTGEDREAIKSLLITSGVFNEEEIACALELVDVYINNASQKDYLIVSALASSVSPPSIGVLKDEVVGYACYGRVSLTKGTYDLYWIAVKPEYQRRGVSKILLRYVEEDIARLSGSMLLAETSSGEAYEKTRRFYKNNGFSEEARIKDFYSKGDDKIIYRKDILLK